MFLSVQWRVRSGEIITVGHQIVFTSSYTDLGVCCKIFPQLDFDDPLTRNIILKDYKSLINNLANINWCKLLWRFSDKQFLDIESGAKNGQKNGLSLLLDVDSFEYSYYPRSAKGFIIGLSSTGEVSWETQILEQIFSKWNISPETRGPPAR